MKSDLGRAVDAYLKRQGFEPDPVADESWRLLSEDETAGQAWRKLLKHSQISGDAVLQCIGECRAVAPFNKSILARRAETKKRHDRLLAAIELLKIHCDGMVIFTQETTDKVPQYRIHNEGVSNARLALTWMREQTTSQAAAEIRRFSHMLPVSQKRSDEAVTFGTMLSLQMKLIFGQPFDEFVAAVVRAMYPRSKDVSLDMIRKNRTRQDARNSARG